VIDRLGTRVGFSLAIIVWSVAAIAHAEAPVCGQVGGRGAGRRRFVLLGLCGGVHGGANGARPGRSWQLPCGYQSRGRVVARGAPMPRSAPAGARPCRAWPFTRLVRVQESALRAAYRANTR
jgi:hypothetical protein